MKTIVYNVKGMMCGGCKSSVTKAVLAFYLVQTVSCRSQRRKSRSYL